MDELRAIADGIEPDERLASYLEQVRLHAYRITDADVQELKDAGVSEDEIFEQTVAVAIGEGLRRFDAAEAVL